MASDRFGDDPDSAEPRDDPNEANDSDRPDEKAGEPKDNGPDSPPAVEPDSGGREWMAAVEAEEAEYARRERSGTLPGGAAKRPERPPTESEERGEAEKPEVIELGGPRSKYDASLTEEERQDRIAELMPNAEKAFGATNWANKFRAGTVHTEFRQESIRDKYPDGVPYSYEGCPEFERYAIKTVRFKDGFSGDYKADFDEANRLAGLKGQPEGTTWHHHEDGYTMHLLDKGVHGAARHWGGVRIVKERGIDADED